MPTSPIPDVDPTRDDPNEFTFVEQPLLKQLVAMDWDFIVGDLEYPAKTGRTSFTETILRDRLAKAIRKLNLDSGGREWLDDLTIERAIRELLKHEGHGLLEMNQYFMRRLVKGVRVPIAEGPRAGEEVQIDVIAWEPERVMENDFLAINQFQVLIKGTPYTKRPDIVLFVNGLPLVVIECKSPAITEPLQSALDDLLHYSGQKRRDVGEREGIPELFHFNALLVGTYGYAARAGTLGATEEHFSEWKDTSPVPEIEVLRELGRAVGPLSSQEQLAAGMLRPAHLLDLVRNFTIWDTEEGRLIKKVARYQQFRATHSAIHQLLTGRTKEESGDEDERGGVIWHTQGSGKSLTMVFLVKKLRTIERLRSYKVVIVTDRTPLERQMRGTAELSGENVRPSKDEKRQNISQVEIVQRILREPGPDLVFCMMQKNQDVDLETEQLKAEVAAYTRSEEHVAEGKPGEREERTRTLTATIPTGDGKIEVLNPDARILLLIDECHRTQAGDFHSYMMGALPNAVKIGFTGTPIFREDDKNTLRIFGRFLDKYGMTASWKDEATVEILYEGRAADGLVEETLKLDQAFSNRFKNYTEEERALIRQRYGNEPDILEAPKLIATKARDMMLHFAGEILPNGFKAQVVAVSRQAVVRYQSALEDARDDLLSEVDALPAEKLTLSPDELAAEPEWTQFLVQLHPRRERLRALEIAACISSSKDPVEWKRWTDPANREDYERRFKLPFDHDDPTRCSPLGMLVVKNMLLTGFDAPVEQVLYLDRTMADHELLQAITRVNRKKSGKGRGYVVDYAGVADALAAAMKAIRDLEEGPGGGGGGGGGVTPLSQSLPRLTEAHRRVLDVFSTRGITSLLPIDPPVQLLADAAIRADFLNKLRNFLSCLAAIFTRPEAAPFKRDAKILAFIARVAANVYQDPQLLLLGVEKKVKELVDTYIAAQGIDPKIPLISILDAKFAEEVKKYGSARTRASAMAHALRLHLTIKTEEDPTLYKTMSEKLEAVLQQLKDRWDEQIQAMSALLKEIEGAEEVYRIDGIEPKIHGPFFGILRDVRDQAGMPALSGNAAELKRVVEVTQAVVSHIQQEIRTVDFWRDANSRKQLENWIYTTLRQSRVIPRGKAEEVAVRLVELAYNRRRNLAT